MADLISLKFTVKFDHCPQFTLSFHLTKFSLSWAFKKSSNVVLRKRKWSKWKKFRKLNFDLNRCLGTCENDLQYENTHFSFTMKNLICFSNFLENAIWAATWQNQQNECAPSEDSDEPGHPPSLIRGFAVRIKKAWVLSYPLSAQRRL